jgi:uncharacterized protein
MQRLILLIVIGFIANWYWRNLKRQREAAGRARRAGSQPGATAGARDTADAHAGNAANGMRGAAGAGAAKGAANGAESGASAARGARGAQLALPEPMVRCAHCDTYLPVSEATVSLDRHFCGPKHARDYAVRVAQAGDGR